MINVTNQVLTAISGTKTKKWDNLSGEGQGFEALLAMLMVQGANSQESSIVGKLFPGNEGELSAIEGLGSIETGTYENIIRTSGSTLQGPSQMRQARDSSQQLNILEQLIDDNIVENNKKNNSQQSEQILPEGLKLLKKDDAKEQPIIADKISGQARDSSQHFDILGILEKDKTNVSLEDDTNLENKSAESLPNKDIRGLGGSNSWEKEDIQNILVLAESNRTPQNKLEKISLMQQDQQEAEEKPVFSLNSDDHEPSPIFALGEAFEEKISPPKVVDQKSAAEDRNKKDFKVLDDKKEKAALKDDGSGEIDASIENRKDAPMQVMDSPRDFETRLRTVGQLSNRVAEIKKDDVLNQIYDKIKVQNFKDLSQLTVKLKPESLGEVAIRLVMDKGVLTGKILVENNHVKNLIEGSLPEIKENLKSQNIDVTGFNVSVGFGNEGQANGQRFFSNRWAQSNARLLWQRGGEITKSEELPGGLEYGGGLNLLA